jgi:hypothetical protein
MKQQIEIDDYHLMLCEFAVHAFTLIHWLKWLYEADEFASFFGGYGMEGLEADYRAKQPEITRMQREAPIVGARIRKELKAIEKWMKEFEKEGLGT